jgi:hypothetical protein
MTVRRAAGYFFVTALAAVSAVGLPCGAWLPFQEARNSDEAWDDFGVVFMAGLLSVSLGVAVTALGAAAYACLRSRRTGHALVALPLAALVLPVAGCACEAFLWQREFQANRRHAEEVIGALEAYRREHGYYPGELGDLPTPPATTFLRGRYTHELKYDGGRSGFTLEYAYGWYTYMYESGTGTWSSRD